MSGALTFALLTFSALFVIVDPIGVVPIFVVLTPDDTARHRQEMAHRACLVAWAVMITFAVGGGAFFRVLGVSLPAFKVAGGLLLLLTGIDQLRAVPARTRTTVEEQSEGSVKDDISITPLAMPLLAGPGSIATAVMLMARAKGHVQELIVLAGITFAIGIAAIALRAAEPISRMLGTVGKLIVERLSGLLLASIAVQFILDGVMEALKR